MYEKLTQCPVCNGSVFTNEIICTDYTVSEEQFVINRCNTCEFLFTNPRPNKEHIHKYYKSDQYISHTSKGNSLVNRVYKFARFFTLKAKQKLISKYKNKDKTLLDYGCGTGHFLEHCKNNGWKISGIEPDVDARKIANENNDGTIVTSISELDPSIKFEVITLWHVLEHVPDLNSIIELLKTKLQSKGTIIVAVPNPDSYDAKHYKQHWAGYDVPRHLYHFTQTTMQALMKKHGLKIIEVLPMPLDSYYVSMLSEKYATGSTKYVKSILSGYKSNTYAKNNNNNYSSLIYIIKK